MNRPNAIFSIRFWILLTTFVWCAIPLSPFKVDSDFWGHVQYGLDVFDHGLPVTSTYTYTSEGYRWINHENLSEIIFAFLVRHMGSEFVLILKCVCGLGVIGLILIHALRRQVATWIIATTMILVAINLSFYWGVRPQFFSFTFFACLIHLYETRICAERLQFVGKSSRAITALLIGLLFVTWTNTHGGFLAGVGVFGLLMFLQVVQQISKRHWDLLPWYCLYGIVAFSVTFANPYGFQLHAWLIESLRVPRPEIFEWHAPNLLSSGSIKTWIVLAATVIGYVASRQKRDPIRLVAFAFVISQALSHQRHLPFVAILFGFWMPEHLQDVSRRWLGQAERFHANLSTQTLRKCATGFACLTLIFAFQVASRLGEIKTSTEIYPVDAVQFMYDYDLKGRMIVTGEWTQYVLHVLGARTASDQGCRVAFDGRFRTCYPQSVIDMHFDFFEPNTDPSARYRSPDSPPVDPTKILGFLRPEFVLLKNSESFALSHLSNDSDWQPIYRDSIAQLWGHRDQLVNRDRSGLLRCQVVETVPRFVPWPAGPMSHNSTRLVSQKDDSNL